MAGGGTNCLKSREFSGYCSGVAQGTVSLCQWVIRSDFSMLELSAVEDENTTSCRIVGIQLYTETGSYFRQKGIFILNKILTDFLSHYGEYSISSV